MKRLMCVLLLLMLSIAACALAEETRTIMALQTPESRVKLRKTPSQEAAILGQYFAGTTVTVLSEEDGWARVSIHGREGYMMSEFLTNRQAADTEALEGVMVEDDGDGKIIIYQGPDTSTMVAGFITPRQIIVLGTVGDGWLHVQVLSDEETIAGFVRSVQVARADRTPTVNSGTAEGTVNFRQSPSRSAEVLGKLFPGTAVHVLFDDHVADDGWQKIRVGERVGYMMDDYLQDTHPQAYHPPMTEIAGSAVQTYAQPNQGGVRQVLGRYDPFYVLGVFGDMYYIRMETWLTETTYGDCYAFVPIRDMQRQVTRSASAEGTITRDTQVCTEDGQVNASMADAWFCPGMKVMLHSYVSPDAQFLLVSGVAENGISVEGYIPADALDYDEGMVLPASFTVG